MPSYEATKQMPKEDNATIPAATSSALGTAMRFATIVDALKRQTSVLDTSAANPAELKAKTKATQEAAYQRKAPVRAACAWESLWL